MIFGIYRRMDIQQLPIIRILKETPLNFVYTLASKEVILRGFEYLKHRKVESFEWEEDFSVLTACVRGTRRYAVNLEVLEGKVEGFCICPAWSPDADCKHVIAVLLAAKSLVSPESRSIPLEQSNYRNALHRSLFLKEIDAGINDPVVPAKGIFGGIFGEKPKKDPALSG